MLKHYEDNGLARYLPWNPFTEEVKTIKAYNKYIPVHAGIAIYSKVSFTVGYRGDVAYFNTS